MKGNEKEGKKAKAKKKEQQGEKVKSGQHETAVDHHDRTCCRRSIWNIHVHSKWRLSLSFSLTLVCPARNDEPKEYIVYIYKLDKDRQRRAA